MNDFKEVIEPLDGEGVWRLYASAKKELKQRGLVRTNNIVGERGEFVAINYYSNTPNLPTLQAAPEGTQNIDAISRKGDRYSIKTISEPGRTTGGFYGLKDPSDGGVDDKRFEFVLIVVVDIGLQPRMIIELTWDQFVVFKKWHSRMWAWSISITKEVIKCGKVVFDSEIINTKR